MTINVFNALRKKNSIFQSWDNSESAYKSVLTIGKETIDANKSFMDLQKTFDGYVSIKNTISNQGLRDGSYSIFNSSYKAIKNGFASGEMGHQSHLFFGGVEKYVPQGIKSLDKSLLETQFGQNLVTKFGGNVAKDFKSVSGSNTAKLAGKSLSKIPVLGILISAAFEIPDIIDGFKNGDGMAQLGRSAVNVACSTLGAAIGAVIFAPCPMVGAFIGGWLGNKLGKCLGNALFGKSIKEKMQSGDMARSTMQKFSSLSYSNLNSQQDSNVDIQKGFMFLQNLNSNLNDIMMEA